MDDKTPRMRMDLDFFPVQYEGRQIVLVRDYLGLVEEGKAVAVHLYNFLTLLDGTRTIRDLQIEMMRQKSGVLVSSDEIKQLISFLDESYILDSERFSSARDGMMSEFAASDVRPCSHCGRSYPVSPAELRAEISRTLSNVPETEETKRKITALVSPHIDISIGRETYASIYSRLRNVKPGRVVVLGVGHHLMDDLYSLTDKDFKTPLGSTICDRNAVKELREAGVGIIAENDFSHKYEHSIEFQLIFLQHILGAENFTIVPILCGSLQTTLNEYGRDTYLKKAAVFLKKLKDLLIESDNDNLLVAGIDLSHIGPKFGHEAAAAHLESQSRVHDIKLLDCLCNSDSIGLWEESKRVADRYNVCGFSVMACMLEVLPECRGSVLDYRIWHEEATKSAVSFSAVIFNA